MNGKRVGQQVELGDGSELRRRGEDGVVSLGGRRVVGRELHDVFVTIHSDPLEMLARSWVLEAFPGDQPAFILLSTDSYSVDMQVVSGGGD